MRKEGDTIKTYQDLQALGQDEEQRKAFLLSAVADHRQSEAYKTAVSAIKYDQRRNETIEKYQKLLYTLSGKAVPDPIRANHKVKSNFFHLFVTQENQYLLGNGLILSDPKNKEKLGRSFDSRLQQAGQIALVEGAAFGFWNLDHLEVFRLSEFVPLWDEESGALKAGIRFWQLSIDRPLRLTLYEEDGYTEYGKKSNEDKLSVLREKRAYKQLISTSKADGSAITGSENYGSLPIVPLWGNPHHQSELVGMREAIDCYDLIKSGFANDLDNASMIYWILHNSGGMDDVDIAKFLERIKIVGAASLDSDEGVAADAHTMEVPYQSRTAYLEQLKNDLYADAQALNVSQLSSGNRTATEINAAYEPLNIKTNLFEYCVLDFLEGIFALAGIDDSASFKRDRIVNQLEETQKVLMAAQYLDDETILNKLPWLTLEEVKEVLDRRTLESLSRFSSNSPVEV